MGVLRPTVMLSSFFVVICGAEAEFSSDEFSFPRTIGGAISDWVLGYGTELEVWNHTVAPENAAYGAYLNHFWSAGGKGAVGQYIADRQVIRYYIDGESSPSIEMEPAMACASGMGWNGLDYYAKGLNLKEKWGSPASTTMFGHSAQSGGGWHNKYKIPFSKSIRITVQLPLDIPTNSSSKIFLIFRGLEGDTQPLRVGNLRLPPTVGWSLRLRKLQTRVKHVKPLQFVTFANYTSSSQQALSGGALLWSLFSIDPFGGALEGCIRAYTSSSGPDSQYPGLLLSTGTEDYYDSAYDFSHGQIVFTEDAGLSHMSQKEGSRLASMYRFHHNDPLYFRQRFGLVWRNGEELETMPDGSRSRKCILRTGNLSNSIGGEVANLTADVWLYTWEQQP